MLLSCLPRFIDRTRYRKIIDRGTEKIDDSLDIRTLIETNRTVKILKRVLLNYRQSVMCELARHNYLASESSDDGVKDIFVEPDDMVQNLMWYKIESLTDRKLIRLI